MKKLLYMQKKLAGFCSGSCLLMIGLTLIAVSLAPAAHGQTPYASRVEVILAADEGPLLENMDSAAFQLASLRVARQALPALRQGINVQLHEATVEQALKTIARQAGLELVYDSEKIAVGKQVTLNAGHVSTYEALRMVLRGTGLRLKALPSGQLVLVPAPDVDRKMSGAGVAVMPLPNVQKLVPAKLKSLRLRVQTGTITGTVTSAETGEPLPGVNVVVTDLVGQQRGAATNAQGRYTIEGVPAGEHTVQAQFIGYESVTKEVLVPDGETTTLNFALRRSRLEMEEVVVTGTGGAVRRRELGVSIATIEGEELTSAPASDLGDMLQGRVPGAVVMGNSGQVGAGSTIRLRGISSITQSNAPLIYIDGVRVSPGGAGGDAEVNQAATVLGSLSPEAIKRIEVIKGPAATTLYGTEAAGGVIQIFTKEGTQGAPQFNLSISQGLTAPNGWGQIGTQDYHAELLINDCTGEPDCPEDGNWYRLGHTQRYYLSARGGSADLNYFLSGEWSRAQGILPQQGTQGYSVRGNFGFAPLEDLRIDFNTFYSHRNIRWIANGNNGDGLFINVLRGEQGYTPGNRDSLVLNMDLRTRINHFIGGLSFDWTPTVHLLQQLTLGLDYSVAEYTEEKPFGFFGERQGARENDTDRDFLLTLDYTGSYELDLGSAVSTTTSWGGQFYRSKEITLNGYAYGFAGPGEKTLSSGARTDVSESRITVTSGGFFGQERIGWKDRLFLTLGVRVDGFSTFGEDFGLAVYPKISGAYLVSDYSFWPDWWNTMKLRAAYGESGAAPSAFAALRTYASVTGDEGEPGVIPGNVGAPNLGPERSREIEAGFNAAFFGGRVTADFTYYNQRTHDALIPVQPIPSKGFIETQLRNVGVISNKGVETQLSIVPVTTDDVFWEVGGYLATSYSEAVDLGGREVISIYLNQQVREGYPVPGVFARVVTNPNEVGAEPEFEEQYLGPVFPTETFGLHTSLRLWDHLTLRIRGEAQMGHYITSGTAVQQVRRGLWPACEAIQAQISKDNTSSLTAGQIARCSPTETTYGMWTRPGDFFKIRSMSITYRLPRNWLPEGIREARVQLQGTNLLTITDYPGLGPEAFDDGSRGSLYRREYYNLPPGRTFSLELNVGF